MAPIRSFQEKTGTAGAAAGIRQLADAGDAAVPSGREAAVSRVGDPCGEAGSAGGGREDCGGGRTVIGGGRTRCRRWMRRRASGSRRDRTPLAARSFAI